jgi:hypothetical protein
MWMRFPDGVERISIQLQEFKIEATDAKTGTNYFRVPNHFAPELLALKGFAVQDPPDGTEIEDLPQLDPLRDGAIADLGKQLEMAKSELANARTDHNVTLGKMAAKVAECETAIAAAAKLTAENEALRERLADLESEQSTQNAIDEKAMKSGQPKK